MKGLAVGQKASATRVFTAADVAGYRVLTGDVGLGFGDQTPRADAMAVPGPLLAGMFSDLLGTRLPGRGTNWLKQQLAFPSPAYLGETITAVVEIIRLRPEKELANLRTTCTNPAGQPVCTGEALVLVRDLQTTNDKPET